MGPLIPLRERTYPLAGYSAVTLGFVRGDSDTADRFPIGLKAQNGSSFRLGSFTTYAQSRECAIAIARHLHVDVEDSTTDHGVRVAPADAERAFRERAIGLTDESAAAQTANARSSVTREPDGVRIDIPVPRESRFRSAAGTRLTTWLSQCAKGRGLTVKTRTGLTSFGEGLEDEEIRYLHGVVGRALHGRS